MIDQVMQSAFEEWVISGQPPLREKPALATAALMTHAAFVEPERQMRIFDALAAAPSMSDPDARASYLASELPFLMSAAPSNYTPPRALWDGFWAIASNPPSGEVDALAFTVSVVSLGMHYDQPLIDRCEAALMQFDGVRQLITEPEVRMKTSDLENHPDDSLATDLLTMLRANGYDLEVIDADTVVLPGNYPAQNRTNRRILQLHDVWHLVAGYGFTGPGEIAISGFQMAQFGQNYSTRFLATVATLSAIHMEGLSEMLFTVIFDGWRHGRVTRDLITVPWHQKLSTPISKLRDELGIRAFDSPMTKMMEAAPAAVAVS